MMVKDNIKNKRLQCGITLEELAQKVGVSRQTIQRYESGVISNIPADNVEKIADALQTTPAALMGWEETSGNTLADKIKKLPKDKQKEVEKIIDTIATGTIAAHRTDDPMDELPEDARKSIEDFKKFIFEKHGVKYL